MVAKSCRDCGRVTQGSQCSDCRNTAERSRKRPSAARRGYDHKYRALRLKVIERAKHGAPCCICGKPFTQDELKNATAEHIIPVRHGGGSSKQNLGPAHAKCNFGWNRTFKP